jgi:amine acid ABC transporter, permease protein, 3-TM region, His/Glu/Gln/Arg/opine family
VKIGMKKIAVTPIWKNKKILPVLLQIIFVAVLALLGMFLINNAIVGLNRIGIKLGFDFLDSPASFSIDDRIISYTPRDSYGRALLVGLLNTVKVGTAGIIISAILGLFIGIGRLSDNWLVKRLTGGYVELIRNTPLLIQIFFLYFAILLPLPKIEKNINLYHIFYFSNRGTAIPWFTAKHSIGIWLFFLIIGLILAVILYKAMLKKQVESGKAYYPFLWSIASVLLMLTVSWVITSELPLQISIPTISGSLFKGGYVISSEFAAILFGLIIYHSAFIAEIVRAGIMAVPKGQIEAAKALGLKKGTIMRLVILPQASRIIIPSATNQFLNLFKNSTLAIAVGYTDLFSIGNTIINQTGRAIEIMVLMAFVYLIVSLAISFLMNYFNKHFQLVER